MFELSCRRVVIWPPEVPFFNSKIGIFAIVAAFGPQKCFFYSPKSASFIQPCKMGSDKWHILVDSKISHLLGFTVLRPNKICSILNENGHIIMPLGVALLISNACSVLLLYLPLLFSPFPPLLCPEKENLSQCTDMYHPSQRT